MAQGIRIICYGLGPIGAQIAKLALQKDDMKIAGSIRFPFCALSSGGSYTKPASPLLSSFIPLG